MEYEGRTKFCKWAKNGKHKTRTLVQGYSYSLSFSLSILIPTTILDKSTKILSVVIFILVAKMAFADFGARRFIVAVGYMRRHPFLQDGAIGDDVFISSSAAEQLRCSNSRVHREEEGREGRASIFIIVLWHFPVLSTVVPPKSVDQRRVRGNNW